MAKDKDYQREIIKSIEQHESDIRLYDTVAMVLFAIGVALVISKYIFNFEIGLIGGIFIIIRSQILKERVRNLRRIRDDLLKHL